MGSCRLDVLPLTEDVSPVENWLESDWLHRWPDWMDRAECQDLPARYFFTSDSTVDDRQKEKDLPGRPVCWIVCPVREECLDWAVDQGLEAGVFGGVVSKRRVRIRQKRRKEAQKSA